jgi:hypothetical protein
LTGFCSQIEKISEQKIFRFGKQVEFDKMGKREKLNDKGLGKGIPIQQDCK